jgi:hypothetical protein
VRHLITGLSLMLAAAAIAGCGEADAGDDANSAQPAQDKQERARAQLESCLREQGVDLAGSQGEGQRPSEQDMEKVQEAMQGPCRKYREQAFGNLSEEEREEARDRMVKFASCMREHGVDMPDPGSGPNVVRIDGSDPKVRRATEACRDLMPRQGRGGGGARFGPGPGGGAQGG